MKTSFKSFDQLVVVLLASATCALAQTSGYNNNQTPPGQPGQYPPAQYPPAQMQPGSMPPGAAAEMVRPGSLNYVEGDVSSNGRALNPQSVGHFTLQPGQSLQTTADGYAEVLLTPGAFLRVGPNSELRMTSVGLADTRINVTHGNALVEADQVIEGAHLEVTMGTTSADILKKGLYGFSTDPQDVRVFDGKLDVIGQTNNREIGKGDQILLANGDNMKKTGFDEKQAKSDPLYVWSEARSRDEAAQNKLVAQNPYGYAPVGGGWFWDPYTNYYGFWPSAYLYSPFGFGFYGGYYPGFYYGGYHSGFFRGGRFAGGAPGFSGVHGNGVGGFHGGGGGGFHGGGGGRR
jgi:hypothetical protein